MIEFYHYVILKSTNSNSQKPTAFLYPVLKGLPPKGACAKLITYSCNSSINFQRKNL